MSQPESLPYGFYVVYQFAMNGISGTGSIPVYQTNRKVDMEVVKGFARLAAEEVVKRNGWPAEAVARVSVVILSWQRLDGHRPQP